MPVCYCVCMRVQKLTAAQRREAAKLYTLEQDANRGSVAGAEKRKRLFRVSIDALLLPYQFVRDFLHSVWRLLCSMTEQFTLLHMPASHLISSPRLLSATYYAFLTSHAV